MYESSTWTGLLLHVITKRNSSLPSNFFLNSNGINLLYSILKYLLKLYDWIYFYKQPQGKNRLHLLYLTQLTNVLK